MAQCPHATKHTHTRNDARNDAHMPATHATSHTHTTLARIARVHAELVVGGKVVDDVMAWTFFPFGRYCCVGTCLGTCICLIWTCL